MRMRRLRFPCSLASAQCPLPTLSGLAAFDPSRSSKGPTPLLSKRTFVQAWFQCSLANRCEHNGFVVSCVIKHCGGFVVARRVEAAGKPLRILGVVFGVAAVVGGMVGQGILRTPGIVAGAANSWKLHQLIAVRD